MKIPFDIFIGGPMGKSHSDAAGESFANHLPNLKAALERIRDELENSESSVFINIHTPELDESGMITSRVFGMIDGAELAIMDLSGKSENVMYELAMLHALGTPTIPVALKDPGGQVTVPFYLQHSYLAVIDNFQPDTLYQRLAPIVRGVISGRGGAGTNPAMNPMTNFYGIALVDISATTGLATGYFDNFIQHVIRDIGGVFSALDYKAKKFVILRPDSLSATSDLMNRTKSRLRDVGVEVTRVTKDGKTVYEDDAQVRKEMLIFRAGRYLFDIPAPLKVQLQSPRYKRTKREADLNERGPLREETGARLKKHEEQLLDKFFDTLRYLARNGQNVDPDLMTFMTLDEFISAVASE